VIYINDDDSIYDVLNFSNKMSRDINKIEKSKNWIGGEYYIQTCLYLLLEKKFKNRYIRLNLSEPTLYTKYIFNICKIIIVPGWTNEILPNNIL